MDKPMPYKCPNGYEADWINPRTNEAVCETEKCTACCPHDERDHGICYDCGDEEDPGAAIDRAMDYFEDR